MGTIHKSETPAPSLACLKCSPNHDSLAYSQSMTLGLCQVRVISNNPLKLQALEEAGLKIVERVSIQVDSRESAEKYLRTKKEKLGHLLDLRVS